VFSIFYPPVCGTQESSIRAFRAFGKCASTFVSQPGLDTLSLDRERGLAVVLIDPDRWVRAPGAWRRSLTLHNRARLRGWRLVRVPTPWLNTPVARKLLEQLSAY